MMSKNGFLLVELMVGLTVSMFFIVITIHYIIEVKAVQQQALQKMERISLERNEREKIMAHDYINHE